MSNFSPAPRLGRRADNKTGVVGVFMVNVLLGATGKRGLHFAACVGRRRVRRFNIRTLGRAEAWRRALAARAEYENQHGRTS